MPERTDSTLADPRDSGIPDHYRQWRGDEAEDYNGPFFFMMEEGRSLTAFRVRSRNCNSHRTVHGGVLMMFADYTLCIAANQGRQESVVTVSCNSEFVGPAQEGDLVRGVGEVIRRGGSLVFVRATLYAGDAVILTASGVVKRLRNAPPPGGSAP